MGQSYNRKFVLNQAKKETIWIDITYRKANLGFLSQNLLYRILWELFVSSCFSLQSKFRRDSLNLNFDEVKVVIQTFFCSFFGLRHTRQKYRFIACNIPINGYFLVTGICWLSKVRTQLTLDCIFSRAYLGQWKSATKVHKSKGRTLFVVYV